MPKTSSRVYLRAKFALTSSNSGQHWLFVCRILAKCVPIGPKCSPKAADVWTKMSNRSITSRPAGCRLHRFLTESFLGTPLGTEHNSLGTYFDNDQRNNAAGLALGVPAKQGEGEYRRRPRRQRRGQP